MSFSKIVESVLVKKTKKRLPKILIAIPTYDGKNYCIKEFLDNLKNFFSNRNKEIKNDQDDLMLIIGEHLEKIEQSKDEK